VTAIVIVGEPLPGVIGRIEIAKLHPTAVVNARHHSREGTESRARITDDDDASEKLAADHARDAAIPSHLMARI
jgi:hypothetical protein